MTSICPKSVDIFGRCTGLGWRKTTERCHCELPPPQTHTATVAMLGKLWNSLNDTEKGSWVSMAQQLHSSSASSAKVGVQPKISPHLTFVSAGTATYNTSGLLAAFA